MYKKTKYWNGEIYTCECGKEYLNFQSLNGHFGHCIIHRQTIGKSIDGMWNPPKGVMCGWSNKTKEEISLIHKKSEKTLNNLYKKGKIQGSFKGRHHKEETKEKLRKAALDNISNKYGGIQANFSSKACDYIDRLNKANNWNLQHALNGGEKRIGNYFVDGYDKQNKIIFEYDERKHYLDVETNKLREKDEIRQNKILNILGSEWKFYRYNEKKDILYLI